MARALPIAAGYIPVGLGYGALAVDAGLTPLHALLMSVIVYAGAAQLIAVGLFASGVPAPSIVATALVVNARHLVMSSALASYVTEWSRAEVAAFGFQITDETFAVHAAQFESGDVEKLNAFATNLCAQIAWVAGTGLGVALGDAIPDMRALGLDFALPALFIALLILQIRSWIHAAVALVAAALAGTLLAAGLKHWTTPVVAAAAAGGGLLLQQALADHPRGRDEAEPRKTPGIRLSQGARDSAEAGDSDARS